MSGKHRRRGDGSDVPADERFVYDDKSAVLDCIHGYYKEALDRLPVEEMPVLLLRLLKAGVCFGPLDPVSNIVANTVAYRPPHTKTNSKKMASIMSSKKRKRGVREITMSRIVNKTESTFSYKPMGPLKLNKMSKTGIARRSLEGLVAFLVCYFRYLRTVEALRYLRTAKADLLVAVRLIEQDRLSLMASFSITSPTTKIALKCAALAAWHPEPIILVTRLLSLSSHLDQVSELMAKEQRLSLGTVERLYAVLVQAPGEFAEMPKLRNLATLRFRRKKKKVENVELYTESLKRVLLDRIHKFYLEAIGRLPTDALCTYHHRGLLKAGHCCGLLDPVSNIIVNTIWYNTAFPAQQEFKVDMISTKSLMRMEYRSLEALVAFLCTLFSTLSEHDAVYYLLLTNANLELAIRVVGLDGHVVCKSQRHVYEAAAVAARHPNPDAQVEFAMAYLDMVGLTVRQLLCGSHILSSVDVELLTRSLSPTSPSPGKSVQPVEKLNKLASDILKSNKRKFEARQSRVRRKVKAALQKYALQNGEPEYELHVICCVNEKVAVCGGATYSDRGNFGLRSKHMYSHFNFFAGPKGKDPKLFFVECCNDDEDKEVKSSSCWPVSLSSTDAGRCFYCEYHGIRTIHPEFENYHGRDKDFEAMALGDHTICNENIINAGDLLNRVGISEEEDSIYFDPHSDIEFVRLMNHRAEDEKKGKLRYG